ncbi:MAG: polysaccharide biosynthesis tyrosine autokinase [Desulfovibrionaceae bacterium]
MQNKDSGIPGLVAANIDSLEGGSPRELITKLFLRFHLLVICVVAVPLVALSLLSLVPPNFTSSAKVLLQYDNANSSFFSEIARPKGQIISGQTNAELMKSTSLCQRVARKLDLQDSDIARPAFKVALGKIAKPFVGLFKSDAGGDSEEDPFIRVGEDFKESIDVKIVRKELSAREVNDELLEVSVASPNRAKVADMARLVCLEFIDEYYRLSEAEAAKAFHYLDEQVRSVESGADADMFVSGTDAKEGLGSGSAMNQWGERKIMTNPMIESAGQQVADLELELSRLAGSRTSDSTEVRKVEAELDRARKLLRELESKEASKFVLSVLKDKRQQAYMTLQLYKNRLIPISIVEEPQTPRDSMTKRVLRYVVVGVAATVGGMALGLALVFFLGAVDRRLYSSWGVSRACGLALVGSIPPLSKSEIAGASLERLPLGEASRAVVQVLGQLDLLGEGGGKVLLVTGAAEGEGKTFITLQLAAALARDKRAKVLLVDGNFENNSISKMLAAGSNAGLVDILKGEARFADTVASTVVPNLAFMAAGNVADRPALGFYRKTLRELFRGLRERYDLIVVDTGGVHTTSDATILASEADSVLAVIRYGVTRREPLQNAVQQLEQVGVRPLGVVMNFRKYPIPKFLYG